MNYSDRIPFCKKLFKGTERQETNYYRDRTYIVPSAATVIDGDKVVPNLKQYVEIVRPKPRIGSIAFISHGYITKSIRTGEIAIDNNEYAISWDDGKTLERVSYDSINPIQYTGPTVYCWKVNKHNKQEIPPHTNKFGQTLEKDVMVIANAGRSSSSVLMFGKVSRWTASTLWIHPFKFDNKIDKYIRFNSKEEAVVRYPADTFVIPEDCLESINSSLILAKLST